jgi:hypothetical protein
MVWGIESKQQKQTNPARKELLLLVNLWLTTENDTVRGPRLLDCPRVLAVNFPWVLDPWYFV